MESPLSIDRVIKNKYNAITSLGLPNHSRMPTVGTTRPQAMLVEQFLDGFSELGRGLQIVKSTSHPLIESSLYLQTNLASHGGHVLVHRSQPFIWTLFQFEFPSGKWAFCWVNAILSTMLYKTYNIMMQEINITSISCNRTIQIVYSGKGKFPIISPRPWKPRLVSLRAHTNFVDFRSVFRL